MSIKIMKQNHLDELRENSNSQVAALLSAIRDYKKIMEDYYSIELAEPGVTKTLNEALEAFK